MNEYNIKRDDKHIMKSSKLKKKLRAGDIVFPSEYVGKVGKKENVGSNEEKKLEQRYHRFLSRSKSQIKEEGQKRSLSVNHRRYETAKSNEPNINITNITKHEDKKHRTFSISKRMKRNCSSIQISKIYYDNLEKKLQQECETILKQQHPKEHIKSYNLQRLTGNLMLLKQRSIKKLTKVEIVKDDPSEELSSRRQVFVSEFSIIDQMNAIRKEQQLKESQKQQESFINISLSGKSIQQSQKMLQPQNFRHHNSLMLQTNNHISQPSQHSFFKSQVDSSLAQALASTKIYFFSPKFSIKYTTYFQILQLMIKINEEKQYEMEIFFQMYNEIIFKRLLFRPSQEKKSNDHRPRKGHMKKLQLIREKLKDKVLSYLLRQYDNGLIIQFYQELIYYLQNLLILQKSYRGLVLIQSQQSLLQLKNHDRIFEMLKINKSFHFILKLNYTFYLVKVIFSPQMDIKFTFVYDFTTHSTGDQLCFSHPAPRKLKENRNQSQIFKVFLRVIQQFSQNITEEWKCQYATNKEIEEKESSAKISQITTCSIQKWDDLEVHKLNNVNKSYHLIGQLTNFFVFHDQFDFGFFNTPHHIFINGQYTYSLDQIEKHVPVYVYPHTYLYLRLTQIQKEMLVIPHVSDTMHQDNAQTYINRFFNREISKKTKKEHYYFIVFINQQQIRMRQREQLLDIYIHSLRNLRCYKLTTLVLSFPSYTDSQEERLDLKKASASVQKFLKCYNVQKSYLYSRLVKNNESRLVIYYKGIQKLQGHFAFLTLYGLPLHQIVEFKIFMFRIGREFIIRFQSIEWLSEVNLKELIANLLQLIKNIYFKKLIQEQARKSKKRRMESLENFLKKHGKSYVNQVRSKKKLDDHVKRRMMKLATLKDNKINTVVYQNIKTDQFTSANGKEFLVTIRYVPSQQFREQSEWKSQNIQICVHKQGCLNYFKLVTSMRDLVHSVSQGKISLEQIDFRQAHLFFKEIRNRIMQIVKTSHSNMGFIINRLKHFLIPNYQLAPASISPFRYKLIHNIFYETKDRVDNSDEIKSQISIQYEMEKQVLVNSNSNLIFLPYLGSQQKPQISSHFSFICKKPVNHPCFTYVDQQYIIQVIDIFRNNEDYKCLKEYNVSTREIWITERQTGCRSILSQWQNSFLSVISLGRFNRRLFRRLIKTLRPSL